MNPEIEALVAKLTELAAGIDAMKARVGTDALVQGLREAQLKLNLRLSIAGLDGEAKAPDEMSSDRNVLLSDLEERARRLNDAAAGQGTAAFIEALETAEGFLTMVHSRTELEIAIEDPGQ